MRKIIYKLGVLLWNKRIISHYNRLKKSEKLSVEELRNNQVEKINELIKWAYQNSSYYKKIFDLNEFKPEDFSSLDDLKKIPITTKKDLLSSSDEIQIRKKTGKLIYSETSGSTGQSLKFYRNKDWDASTRAAMFRGYSWYNVEPWEKNGYLWGYNTKSTFKVKLLDFFQNRFRLFSYNRDAVIDFSKKLESAVFLEGYSSMIYETAKIINRENNFKKPNLKLVKGTSEKIFDYYHRETLKAFGKKIVSEYGAAETGLIAFECPNGNMHVTMENVIVEEVNNEIIVTNLWSYSFPIIRYKLGDYVSLKKESCSCGMQHDIIGEVTGRIGNIIFGIKDVYPSLVLYYIFKNLATKENLIIRYQAQQKEKGKLVFRIENDLSEIEIQKVLREARSYFNDDIYCEVITNVEPIRLKGKLKDFISDIS